MKKQKNNLRELIPHFIKFIESCGVANENIINSHSYFKSQVGPIKNNGTLLEERLSNNSFVVFEVILNKKIITEEQNDDTIRLDYQASLILDIYGMDSYEISTNIVSGLFKQKNLFEFKKQCIGLINEVEMTNTYETIHGVQWNRANINIPFYHYRIVEGESDRMSELGELRTEVIND